MRTCSKCFQEKGDTEFYSSVTNKIGYQSRCKPCCKEGAAIWVAKNIDLVRKRKNEREKAARRARGLKAFPRTPDERTELHRKQERERYQNNKVVQRSRIARYKQTNPHLVAQLGAKRKATQRNATPKWANQFFVKEAYALAALRTKVMGFKWHADHTVPLCHDLVCGLHNEFNLAVIPASENCSKQNRYWPDMPERQAYLARAQQVIV